MKTNNLLRSALVAALLYAPATAGKPLPRSTPEAQGVSSQAILEFTNTLDQRFDGIHSLMIVRDGQVIAEGWWTPYGAEHNHILFSLSKSFTSTAVGLAVAEGLLDIDDAVIDFFPEMENQMWAEGHGQHKGFFEISFLPHFGTRKNLDYLHNGKDNIAFDLKY